MTVCTDGNTTISTGGDAAAVEIVGHNSLLSEVFGDPVSLGCTNLASDVAIAGLKLLIDAILETFPTTPIMHIVWDEVGTDNVAKASTAPAFCKRHGLSLCNEGQIVDYFLTTLNEYVRTKTHGKIRLMAYENVNTPGTANHTVITPPLPDRESLFTVWKSTISDPRTEWPESRLHGKPPLILRRKFSTIVLLPYALRVSTQLFLAGLQLNLLWSTWEIP